MQPISYTRHQFPAEVIRHAISLYLWFTLRFRDVEELLTERGTETTMLRLPEWPDLTGPGPFWCCKMCLAQSTSLLPPTSRTAFCDEILCTR